MRPLAERFAPGAEHVFLPPVATAVESVGRSGVIVGWSLGAWRVLEAASRGVRIPGKVLLLAPFVAFCSEFGLGGRCSQTQVGWLQRWMRRNPGAALQDFYQRAGLGEAPAQMPYAQDGLLEGLARLAEDASPELRQFATKGLPEQWQAVIGQADPLLDAAGICSALPGCSIVPGAGHAPEQLIAALGNGSHAV
ncbi:MAG TPA: alpha/beta fold hydrolase [Candidatus Sulfotelmatobacter sp.]|nr:alpha/beta fold hydrolase [Candidatus Sulfotelmatobacter sp.]